MSLSVDNLPDIKSYEAAFLSSAREGDLKKLKANAKEVEKYLKGDKQKIHETNNRGLREAATKGHINIIKHLVTLGSDLHWRFERTLKEAAISGYLDIVKYLVNKGADIHIDCGLTILYAEHYKHSDIVDYLIKISPVCKQYIMTELNLKRAACAGELRMVKFLVEQGRSIFEDFGSIMRVARNTGNREVVEYLVEQGGDGNAIEFLKGAEDLLLQAHIKNPSYNQ